MSIRKIYRDLYVLSEEDWFKAFDTVFEIMIKKHFKDITKEVKDSLNWYYTKTYIDFAKEFDFNELIYAKLYSKKYALRVVCVDDDLNSYTKIIQFKTIFDLKYLPYGEEKIYMYDFMKLYHKYNSSKQYLGYINSQCISFFEVNEFICDCYRIVFNKFTPKLCGKYLNSPILENGFVKDLGYWTQFKRGNFTEFLDTLSGVTNKNLFGTKLELKTMEDILFDPSIYDIRCETGNMNKKSFDFIDIEIPYSDRVDINTVKELLVANKNEIVKNCLYFLDNNKKFKKYGVPSSYLCMTKWVMTRDHRVILTFELKKIKGFETTSLI